MMSYLPVREQAEIERAMDVIETWSTETHDFTHAEIAARDNFVEYMLENPDVTEAQARNEAEAQALERRIGGLLTVCYYAGVVGERLTSDDLTMLSVDDDGRLVEVAALDGDAETFVAHAFCHLVDRHDFEVPTPAARNIQALSAYIVVTRALSCLNDAALGVYRSVVRTAVLSAICMGVAAREN